MNESIPQKKIVVVPEPSYHMLSDGFWQIQLIDGKKKTTIGTSKRRISMTADVVKGVFKHYIKIAQETTEPPPENWSRLIGIITEFLTVENIEIDTTSERWIV